MRVTAQITIEYNTQEELNGILERVPEGVTPIVDEIGKKVSFTVIQENVKVF